MHVLLSSVLRPQCSLLKVSNTVLCWMTSGGKVSFKAGWAWAFLPINKHYQSPGHPALTFMRGMSIPFSDCLRKTMQPLYSICFIWLPAGFIHLPVVVDEALFRDPHVSFNTILADITYSIWWRDLEISEKRRNGGHVLLQRYSVSLDFLISRDSERIF